MAMQELLDRLRELSWDERTIDDVSALVLRHSEPYKYLVLRPRYRDVAIITAQQEPPLGIAERIRREPGYRRARFEVYDVSDHRPAKGVV